MAQYNITIGNAGRSKIDAVGFVGTECKEKGKEIVRALGGDKAGNADVTDKEEIHMTGGIEEAETVIS